MRKTFVVVGGSVFGARRPNLSEVIGKMKADLVRCYERDVANRDVSVRRPHHVRLSLSVDASGKVQEIQVPQWDPANPVWDPSASGSPRPNPMNVGDATIQCLKTRLQRARFGVADGPSTIGVDVRTMPQ